MFVFSCLIDFLSLFLFVLVESRYFVFFNELYFFIDMIIIVLLLLLFFGMIIIFNDLLIELK